jgi:hypothetical protein
MSVPAEAALPEEPMLPTPAFPPFHPETVAPPGYELAPVLDASAVVPEDIRGSPLYTIHPDVYNDGRFNHYLIESPYGSFVAEGAAMLAVRAHEIYATATLVEMSGGEAFGRGLGEGLKDVVTGPFRAVAGVFRNPLNLVRVLPRDAIRAVEITTGIVKVVGSGFGKDDVKDLMGYTDARRDLAGQLQVDASTSNPVLSQALDEMAWRYYAGGLPISIGEDFVPGVPIPRLSVWGGGMGAGSLIRTIQPGSASRKMRRMDVERPWRKALDDHPHLRGRHLDAMADTLYEMKDVPNRAAFFHAIFLVDSETLSLSYVAEAELLRLYHETVAPLTDVGAAEGRLYARSEAGELVIPWCADHLAWTPELEADLDRLRAAWAAEHDAAPVVLWTTGTVSDAAGEALEARGVQVCERVSGPVEEE